MAEQWLPVAQFATVCGKSNQHGRETSRDVEEKSSDLQMYSEFPHLHFFLGGDNSSKVGMHEGCQTPSPK